MLEPIYIVCPQNYLWKLDFFKKNFGVLFKKKNCLLKKNWKKYFCCFSILCNFICSVTIACYHEAVLEKRKKLSSLAKYSAIHHYRPVVHKVSCVVFSQGYRGITTFIVDGDSEGLTVGKSEDKMGLRSTVTCTVHFDNVRVSVAYKQCCTEKNYNSRHSSKFAE